MMSNDNKDHIEYSKEQVLDLIRNNRLQEAKAALSKICEANSEDDQSWYMLSSVNGMLGHIDEAGECCRRVLAIKPNHSDAHLNMGNVLFHQGKKDEAISHYHASLDINPNHAGALCCLGNCLASTGEHQKAIENYQAAIRLNPNIIEAYYNLGNSLTSLHQYEAAVENYRQAIRLNPRYALAYNNLGSALKRLGAIESAMDCYRQAIAIDPNMATAYNNLAIIHRELLNLSEAEKLSQKSLEILPNFIEAHINLSSIHNDQGRPKAAIEHLRKVLSITKNRADVHSSLISSMRYLSEYTPQDLLDEARRWAALYTPQEGNSLAHYTPSNNQRHLRVGYVSGDYCNHPVGHFIELVLANHNRSQFEIFCYYVGFKQDSQTKQLRQLADHWRDVPEMHDYDLAQQIRMDAIDILIDLSGHTKTNRLLTFALKPAPVQATWLGDPASTGLPAMDYIICDTITIPPQEERFHSEQVMRLPTVYECFKPPEYAIEPAPPPALDSGKITLGCFNNPAKITESVIACWSKLLYALPESRLFLKYKPYDDNEVQKYFLGLFHKYGIEADRIIFSGFAPNKEFLSAYNQMDIALDTFPYNGGFTTLEALWMGIPVISLRQNRFVGRMGETLLTNVGLREFVVDSEDEYIEKTIMLASDLPRLIELRSRLRSQLLESPVCDGPGFTRDLETAYHKMWELWCNSRT